MATLAAPLFALTSSKSKFVWTEEAEKSVQALKQALMSTPVLARYDHDLETRVTTDASLIGLGAVLEQKHGDTWRPVGYWSRKLLDAETRYSATDLEWLAVVEALSRAWRHQLEDIHVTVRSDHAALARELTRSADDRTVTPRQSRWIERLMPFHITFEYIPGKENVVSDALSRYPSLATYSFSLTLIHPYFLGILARIAFIARGDTNYQELMTKVIQREADQSAMGHTIPAPISLEEIAANPDRSQLELNPDQVSLHLGEPDREVYPLSDRSRQDLPLPEVIANRDLNDQGQRWSEIVLANLPVRACSCFASLRNADRQNQAIAGPRRKASRTNQPRNESETRSGRQNYAQQDPNAQLMRREPLIELDRIGLPRRTFDSDGTLLPNIPVLPRFRRSEWGIPDDEPATHTRHGGNWVFDSPRPTRTTRNQARRSALRRPR